MWFGGLLETVHLRRAPPHALAFSGRDWKTADDARRGRREANLAEPQALLVHEDDALVGVHRGRREGLLLGVPPRGAVRAGL